MKVLNFIKTVATEFTDISTFKSLVKIAGKAVDVPKAIPEMKIRQDIKDASECLSFITSFLTIHTGYLSLKGFIKNAKMRTHLKGVERTINDLEMVSQLCGMATGIMSSIKVVETLDKWAHVGTAMGKVAVSTTTPFTQATPLLAIINLSVQIGIGFLKLYNLEKKVNKVKDKVTFWQGDMDKTFIQNRITHIQTKQDTLIVKVEAAGKKVVSSNKKVATSVTDLDDKKTSLKNKKGIKKAFAWVSYKNCKRSHHSLLAKQTKIQEDFLGLHQKHKDNSTKIENWTAMSNKLDHLTQEDVNDINRFKMGKQAKWRTKKSNLRLEQWKGSLGIALKTAVLVTLIASFILTTTGTGTVPGLITLASLGLFLSVASLGLDFYKKYRKPRKVRPVAIPTLPNQSVSAAI